MPASSSHHIKCASEPASARVHSEYKVYAMIPTEAIIIVGRPRRASIYGIPFIRSHIAHVLYDLYEFSVRYIFPFREKTQDIQQKKKKKGNTTPRGGRCLFYKRCIQSQPQ